MKTLEEVISQASQSEAFDTILREAAKNAVSQGVGTNEWVQFMNFFAESPGELDELSNPHEIVSGAKKCRAFRTCLTYTSATCPETLFANLDEEGFQSSKKPTKQGDARSKSGEKTKRPKPAKNSKRSAT